MARKRLKTLTRLVTFLLAMVMLFSGCGKSKSDEELPELSDNFNAEGLPILKEPETFTIAVKQMSPLKSAAAKACVLEAEKATNVHIEWIEIPGSGWKEKLNVMASTDALPDAVLGDLSMSKDYELYWGLDEYLDKYAPHVTEFFATREDYPRALIAPDGQIKFLPSGDESVPNMIDSMYWINQKWLDALNLEMPQTTEELKQVLIAFRDGDPNGNGIQDEIPFTFGDLGGFGTSIENMFGSFGVMLFGSGHIYLDKDNKVMFSAEQQGYYDALSYFSNLYSEGLVDKDVFTMSNDQYYSKDPEGDTVGLLAGYNYDVCGCNDPSIYRPLPLLKGPNGIQMVGVNNVAKSDYGLAISKKCKNPAALVRWYDYINSSMELTLQWSRGEKGVSYDIIEQDGKQVAKFFEASKDVLQEKGGYTSLVQYRKSEAFAGQTPSLWRLEYDEAVIYDDSWSENMKIAAVHEMLPYGVHPMPAGTASRENAERRAILSTDITTYLKKFIADSVINGIDEAKWTKHLNTLEKLHTDEFKTLCQEYTDSILK